MQNREALQRSVSTQGKEIILDSDSAAARLAGAVIRMQALHKEVRPAYTRYYRGEYHRRKSRESRDVRL